MAELEYAHHFSELIVWRKSRLLARDVFDKSKQFPSEEKFSLTDQIRRSSRSIGAQIAEAWAKRRYEKHFISKLTDADGEQNETQHWIIEAWDAKYLSRSETEGLGTRCKEIGAMLGRMIGLSSKFCGIPPSNQSPRLKEASFEPDFFASTPLKDLTWLTDY